MTKLKPLTIRADSPKKLSKRMKEVDKSTWKFKRAGKVWTGIYWQYWAQYENIKWEERS